MRIAATGMLRPRSAAIPAMNFSPIPELIDEIRAGRMIVMLDDEDRENEGEIGRASCRERV